MAVILTVCAAFGLTVSGAKNELTYFRRRGMLDATATFSVEAADQVFQGAEFFVAKWMTAERARASLRHVVTCPNVTGRTKASVLVPICLPLLTSHTNGVNFYLFGDALWHAYL